MKQVNKSGLPGNDLFAFLNVQKGNYGQLKKWMKDIVTALMAGIKLASCVVNNLYGKGSFRENPKMGQPLEKAKHELRVLFGREE